MLKHEALARGATRYYDEVLECERRYERAKEQLLKAAKALEVLEKNKEEIIRNYATFEASGGGLLVPNVGESYAV